MRVPERIAACRLLERALTGTLHAALITVTLLYSRWFSDNLLAKDGLLLVLAGLLCAVLALGPFRRQGLCLPRLPWLYLPFAAFCAWGALSAARSHNPLLGMESLLVHGAPFLLFLGVLAQGGGREGAWRLLDTLLGLDLIVSGLGGLQYFGVDPLGIPGGSGGLPVSTLGNPNFAAYYQVLMLPVPVAWLLGDWRGLGTGRRIFLGATAVLAGLHLILAASRAGWFSAAVGLAVLLLLLEGRRRGARPLLGAVLVLLLLQPVATLFLRSVPWGGGESLYSLTERIGRQTWERGLTAFDPSDFSRHMRVLIWQDTGRMIQDQPLWGVGPGQY